MPLLTYTLGSWRDWTWSSRSPTGSGTSLSVIKVSNTLKRMFVFDWLAFLKPSNCTLAFCGKSFSSSSNWQKKDRVEFSLFPVPPNSHSLVSLIKNEWNMTGLDVGNHISTRSISVFKYFNISKHFCVYICWQVHYWIHLWLRCPQCRQTYLLWEVSGRS